MDAHSAFRKQIGSTLSLTLILGFILVQALCPMWAAESSKANARSSANASGKAVQESVPAHLPGELSAEDVLNGSYPFPPSPASPVRERAEGFDASRLGKVPPPGVHPRILTSPEERTGILERLNDTKTGRALYENLRHRLGKALNDPKNWTGEFYQALASGNLDRSRSLIAEHGGLPPAVGHYQPFLEVMVWEAFEAWLTQDQERGRRVATAITTYAELIRPLLESALKSPLHDDVWRVKITGPVTGLIDSPQGIRDAMAYHDLGYAYDFAHPFMDEKQRDTVRSVIAAATAGKLWMGARLPHHFRNWNWCAVGLSQPLLSLAIEGEKGYDPRVYRMGVDIARDYLTYGISPKGVSTEAIGYTQFGLVWANPFFVAAARRGDNLLFQDHHRSMIDWYLASLHPDGKGWTSHGDGGVYGPSLPTMLMWKTFYPSDPVVDLLLRRVLETPPAFRGFKADLPAEISGAWEKLHMIEPLLWAADPSGSPDPASLGAPLTFFDPERSFLASRSSWDPDALHVEMECRTDSVGSSHEHADRGNFTLAALGRIWAKENRRSVETRHHNGILIDGKGQGFWGGPGKWLGLADSKDFLIAACDAKEAYDWWWPKQGITGDPQMRERYAYPRWDSFKQRWEDFRKVYGDGPFEKDPRPSVVAHWKGFEEKGGGPRMWDEDAWPVRLPFNPVMKAFRTLLMVRGEHPYAIVVDDIQKDPGQSPSEHLYEWLMQTGENTDVVWIRHNDILLCDASASRDGNGQPKPKKGDRLLLVRVLNANLPKKAADYSTKPSFRLDTFERKDTLVPDVKGSFSGSSSYGIDRRLVIASRSVSPDFRILLYPMREGDSFPEITWKEQGDAMTLKVDSMTDQIGFKPGKDGRTRVSASRNGSEPLTLELSASANSLTP